MEDIELELTREEVLSIIKDKKYKKPNPDSLFKLLTRKPNEVIINEKVYFIIDRDYLNQIEINEVDNFIKSYATLELFFIKESEVYKVDMKIPYILEINFTEYFKSGDSVIFILEENSSLFRNNLYQNNIETASNTFSSVINGKINDIMKMNYDELPKFLLTALEENEAKGHPMLPLEILFSALCRDASDSSQEFRHTIKSYSDLRYDKFQMINIREVPRNNSAFSAISSENISEGLITTIVNNKTNTNNRLSPMEAIALNKLK